MSMQRKSNHSDVLAMLNEAKEMTALQRQIVESDLESKGYDVEKLWSLLNFQLEDPDRLGVFEEKLKSDVGFLCRTYESARIKKQPQNPDAPVETEMTPETCEDPEGLASEMIKIFADLKDIRDSEKELKDLENESTAAMRKYVDDMSSPEKEEKRLAELAKNKALLEKTTDIMQRKRLERRIYNEESRYNLAFVFERMNNPKYREKEMKNMVYAFFDTTTSSYVMRKYVSKAKQCGKNPALYRYFHGMEEKYLEEKYHVYNNFFLFSCLRYIAYADAYNDYPRIQAIFNDFGNLIYNRFVNEDVKEQFLNAARNFLDQFEDMREKFEADNILHPKHPYRIQKDQEREAEQRKEICKHLTEIKAIEDVTEEINAMSLEELIAFAKEKDEIHEHRQHMCEEILHLQMFVDNAQGTTPEEGDVDLDAKSMEELEELLAYLRKRANELYSAQLDDEEDEMIAGDDNGEEESGSECTVAESDDDDEEGDTNDNSDRADSDSSTSDSADHNPGTDSEDSGNDAKDDAGAHGATGSDPRVLEDSFGLSDSVESNS